MAYCHFLRFSYVFPPRTDGNKEGLIVGYTEEQVDSTSKLMIDALYRIKTLDEAMEQMYCKDVKAYSNFKLNVENLKNLLKGKIVYHKIPCNWAKAYYKYLKNTDKVKFLDAMERQEEYNLQKNNKTNKKLKKWILSQKFLNKNKITIIYPDEIEDKNLFEGAKKQITINAYERSTRARNECIKKYGYKCTVCKFDFEKMYGELGKNFIHVHHLKALSEIDEKYKINPIEDLRPVCPNCHAMLHKKIPAYSIEEIQNFIKQNNI